MHYAQNFVGTGRAPKFDLIPETLDARQKVLDELQQGELPMLQPAIAAKIFLQWQSIVQSWRQEFTDVVVLGTGGSSLGAQTLVALKQGCCWQEAGHPRLHFLDNLDATTFGKLLENLDAENTGFLVISKSGYTAETLCQSLLLLQQLEGSVDVADQVLVITQKQPDSPLLQLSQKFNLKVLEHPVDIGGRFSAFTVVGLLPALLAGVDIKQVLAGAKDTIEAFTLQQKHPAVLGAQMHNVFLQDGYTSNVLMPYTDRLYPLSLWFRQLWAESLGKNNAGTTPVQALGPVDQHSQLQLYLDGPKDKFFTILKASATEDTKALDPETAGQLGLNYLAGKTMGQLNWAESLATVDTLVAAGCPTRTIDVTLDEQSLGALMMHFFLETILTAQLWQVNPFDQPAVEASKRLTKTYLLEGENS
ncbi:MAG: glucose-6-phosphate isomerase [Pseudomonadota bacterium]